MIRDRFFLAMQDMVELSRYGVYFFHEDDPTLVFIPPPELVELPPISDDSIDTAALTWSREEIRELLGFPNATGLAILTLKSDVGDITAYIFFVDQLQETIGLRRLMLLDPDLDQGLESSWDKRGIFWFDPEDMIGFIMERRAKKYTLHPIEEKFLKVLLRASRE